MLSYYHQNVKVKGYGGRGLRGSVALGGAVWDWESEVICWKLVVVSRTVTKTQLSWLWASDQAWQGVARQLCDPNKGTIDGRWGWGAQWPFSIPSACLESFKWQTLWRRYAFYVPTPNSMLAPVSNVQMFALKYTKQRARVDPSHHFNSGP